MATYGYYSCCGKHICSGCMYSFRKSGNDNKCPFCNSDRADITDEEEAAQIMKRVEANDAGAMYEMGAYYHQGRGGLLQDWKKARELYARAGRTGFGGRLSKFCLKIKISQI